MPKISFIIPCLNVSLYINECIDSLVHQTCFEECELLIVDAGSKDGTLEIVSDYEREYSNIHLLLSDVKSYGYQVNMAVRMATGKYIGIVDSDDYVNCDAYAILYEKAERYEYDFVKGLSYCFVDWESKHLLEPIFSDSIINRYFDKCLIPDEHPELFSIDWNLWNGIYRAEIFKRIKLSETAGAAFQDIGAVFRLLYSAQKGYLMNLPTYYYRVDNASASSKNARFFSYAAYEYNSLLDEFSNAADSWKRAILLRIMSHFIGLIEMAAEIDAPLDNSMQDILTLQELLKTAIEKGTLSANNTNGRWEDLQSAVLDVKTFYNCQRDSINGSITRLRAILGKCTGKDVVIFGCGQYGRFLNRLVQFFCKYISKMEDDICRNISFCDNNEEKQGQEIDGVRVLSPKDACDTYPNAVYLIATKGHECCVEQQLISLGIDGNRIIVYTDRIIRIDGMIKVFENYGVRNTMP